MQRFNILRTARAQVATELQVLREQAAEAEAARRKVEAQTNLMDLATKMQATADQVKPLLHTLSGLTQTAELVAEYEHHRNHLGELVRNGRRASKV